MSQSERDYYYFALKIMGDFGATIAIPVVGLALLGEYLDERFNTHPYLLVTGFTLAALMSGYTIYKKAKQYGKRYEELTKTKKQL